MLKIAFYILASIICIPLGLLLCVISVFTLPFGINIFELMSSKSDIVKDNKSSNSVNEFNEHAKYMDFIENFNRLNQTHYSVSPQTLVTEFVKCIIAYINEAKYSLPKEDSEFNGWITLPNYRCRGGNDKYKNSKVYKLNTCNLFELTEKVETQDIQGFYTVIFEIPLYTFALEKKLAVASYIKNYKFIKIDVMTTYLDTREVWSNTFILANNQLTMKCRDWGDMSKFE